MKYKVTPARLSSEALLVPKFAVVDIEIIGTHEIPNNVHGNQKSEVLASLKDSGYNGPLITVFEVGKDAIYDSIPENTFAKIELKYGQIGVVDGHNRLAALTELYASGNLASRLIPVQIIPVRKSDIVQIKVTDPSDKVWTLEQIESCFSLPDKTMIDSDNTSHFEVAFRDGVWRRIREAQPDVSFDL